MCTPLPPILDTPDRVALPGAPIRADSLSMPPLPSVIWGESENTASIVEPIIPIPELQADDPEMPDLVYEEAELPLPQTPAARTSPPAGHPVEPYLRSQSDRSS